MESLQNNKRIKKKKIESHVVSGREMIIIVISVTFLIEKQSSDFHYFHPRNNYRIVDRHQLIL